MQLIMKILMKIIMNANEITNANNKKNNKEISTKKNQQLKKTPNQINQCLYSFTIKYC